MIIFYGCNQTSYWINGIFVSIKSTKQYKNNKDLINPNN